MVVRQSILQRRAESSELCGFFFYCRLDACVFIRITLDSKPAGLRGLRPALQDRYKGLPVKSRDGVVENVICVCVVAALLALLAVLERALPC